MTDTIHEIQVLISIARLDAELNKCRKECDAIPKKVETLTRDINQIDKEEKEASEHYEAMTKERRNLEVSIEDAGVQIGDRKTKLMAIKTNKEYTAMLKEIEALENGIDEKEESLLILMDELEQQEAANKVFQDQKSTERATKQKDKNDLEARERTLNEEIQALESKKPAFLSELNPQLKKRYERLLKKLKDYAVTNIVGRSCQGCGSRLPPQFVNEVKKNERIIPCETCGRILVYFE